MFCNDETSKFGFWKITVLLDTSLWRIYTWNGCQEWLLSSRGNHGTSRERHSRRHFVWRIKNEIGIIKKMKVNWQNCAKYLEDWSSNQELLISIGWNNFKSKSRKKKKIKIKIKVELFNYNLIIIIYTFLRFVVKFRFIRFIFRQKKKKKRRCKLFHFEKRKHSKLSSFNFVPKYKCVFMSRRKFMSLSLSWLFDVWSWSRIDKERGTDGEK